MFSSIKGKVQRAVGGGGPSDEVKRLQEENAELERLLMCY
eukprot:gene24206-35205_t